jgi:hypothetical protein
MECAHSIEVQVSFVDSIGVTPALGVAAVVILRHTLVGASIHVGHVRGDL